MGRSFWTFKVGRVLRQNETYMHYLIECVRTHPRANLAKKPSNPCSNPIQFEKLSQSKKSQILETFKLSRVPKQIKTYKYYLIECVRTRPNLND